MAPTFCSIVETFCSFCNYLIEKNHYENYIYENFCLSCYQYWYYIATISALLKELHLFSDTSSDT